MIRKPKEHLLTRHYFKGIYCLRYASHWICPLTGDKIKVPHGLKLYYEHRLNKFRYFSEKGSLYKESHPTCAKLLGLSEDTIVKTYNPLLHRMGLLHTVGEWKDNNCHYIVNELSEMDGWLVNDKLHNTISKTPIDKQHSGEQEFTYENLKKLQHNKEKARMLRTRNDEYMTIISRDEYRELIKIKQQSEG